MSWTMKSLREYENEIKSILRQKNYLILY